MAYEGYLIKVGDYVIPNSLMAAESYIATYQGQDLDSYQDANGDLQRGHTGQFCFD